MWSKLGTSVCGRMSIAGAFKVALQLSSEEVSLTAPLSIGPLKEEVLHSPDLGAFELINNRGSHAVEFVS